MWYPVHRILKSEYCMAVRHGERNTMDDLECQIFIQIYREKITETIDLSSPSFLDASVKTFYKHYLLSISVS